MNIAFFVRISTAEVKNSILWVNMIIFCPIEVSKGVPEILRTKEVRGVSQKKGKKTKRYVPRLSNCGDQGY